MDPTAGCSNSEGWHQHGGEYCGLGRILSQRSCVYSFSRLVVCAQWSDLLLLCRDGNCVWFSVVSVPLESLVCSGITLAACCPQFLSVSFGAVLCWPCWAMSDLSVQPNAAPALNSNLSHPSGLYTVKIGVNVSPVASLVNTGNSVPLSFSTLVLSVLCPFLILVCRRPQWFF